jgi:hypothetical protein
MWASMRMIIGFFRRSSVKVSPLAPLLVILCDMLLLLLLSEVVDLFIFLFSFFSIPIFLLTKYFFLQFSFFAFSTS